jgi:hypothetical protein
MKKDYPPDPFPGFSGFPEIQLPDDNIARHQQRLAPLKQLLL